MWPNGKKFAFTIIDDTDNSTVENVSPVYDLLLNNKIFTTKTVWVYPSRDSFTGGSIDDVKYYDFIKELSENGFEVGLHNVGSGKFNRTEISNGIEMFKDKIGKYPIMHINHANNEDNIYWGYKRFTLIRPLMKFVQKKKSFTGDEPNSDLFWGDISKKHIKYIRNHVFNGINTYKYDSEMPYRVKSKDKYSNYWFSSSDGHTIEEFNDLIKKENIDKLEEEGGCCIVYTHFASGFVTDGELNEEFKNNIINLGKRDGWFAPASEILDYLLSQKKSDEFASSKHLAKLDLSWLKERVIKKYKYKR